MSLTAVSWPRTKRGNICPVYLFTRGLVSYTTTLTRHFRTLLLRENQSRFP